MPKQTMKGAEARQSILTGVTRLAEFVRATMGPKGRNVLFEKQWNSPTITNDGVTIAKQCEWENRFENIGAQIVKEAASKTNSQAGDGTTASVVLAHAMMSEGLHYLDRYNLNPVLLKRGMEKAVATVNAELDKRKMDITTKDQMTQIATISSQSDEVGALIAQIFDKVGKEGVVQVEESNTMGMSIEMVDGMQFDNGYISPHMVTDYGRMEAVYEDASILLTDKKIISFREFLPLLEAMLNAGKKHLVIIAEDVEGDALATLVVNRMKGSFMSVAVKAPGFGDRRKQMLQDLAVLTGGTLISSEMGMKLENTTMEQLGHAKKVVVSKDATTIIDGQGEPEKIKARIEQIRTEYEAMDKPYEKEKLQERLAKLTGGVALLRVGAATEVELKDKKLRIEDALSATRSAIEEGIVIGGGCALLQASLKINPKEYENEAERVGAEIVKKALSYPFVQIAQNAGDEEPRGLISLLKDRWAKNPNIGLNADEDIQDHSKCIVDMFKKGIIDPKKVARCAMENAVSVAAMFLTTEGVIVDLPEKKDLTGGGRMI